MLDRALRNLGVRLIGTSGLGQVLGELDRLLRANLEAFATGHEQLCPPTGRGDERLALEQGVTRLE